MMVQVFECVTCGDVWRGVEYVSSIQGGKLVGHYECACGLIIVGKKVNGADVYYQPTPDDLEAEFRDAMNAEATRFA